MLHYTLLHIIMNEIFDKIHANLSNTLSKFIKKEAHIKM